MTGRKPHLGATVNRKIQGIARRLNLMEFQGNIDGLIDGELKGWVVRCAGNVGGQKVGLYAQDGLIRTTFASLHRGDVKAAGLGGGDCGFSFAMDASVESAARESGGRLTVRVLGGSNFIVGSQVLYDVNGRGRLAKRSLQRPVNDPKLEQCRQQLYGDLQKLTELLAVVDLTEHLPRQEPLLLRHGHLLETEPLLPGAHRASTLSASDLSLPAYLEFTRSRTRQDRHFDTEGNPDDREHFLDWYIMHYAIARNGLRVPLSKQLLAHLNAPIVMGGAKRSFTRVMWWRMLRSPVISCMMPSGGATQHLSPSVEDHYLPLLYWWVWSEARSIHAEDCLVTNRHADILRTIQIGRAEDLYPLTNFMEFFFANNQQFHFLNLSLPSDRRIFTLCLILMAAQRPDILRYLPDRSIRQAFDAKDQAPSAIEDFYVSLAPTELARPLTFARFGKALRRLGYDADLKSFRSVTRNGDRLHTAALDVPVGEKVDLQMIGPFAKASGLGQATRLSADVIERSGHKVNCVDFGLDNPAPEGFSGFDRPMGTYRPAKINLIHLNAESIPLCMAFAPDVFSNSYNIGYFFWELDTPATCHFLGLKMLDEIWVSTEYGAKIYRPHVDMPVTNVGMAFEDLPTIDRAQGRKDLERRLRLTGDEFIVLVAFDSYSFVQRKNPVAVLEAFQQAFHDVPKARLVVKTQNRGNVADPVQHRIWNRIDAIVARDARISIIDETFGYVAQLAMKAAADCYVSLHRSEGWGFGMIEAMNLGVPVVCTAYSGNMDFCSDETAWLVRYTEVLLGPDDYIFVRPGQKWAEPDVSHAAAQLRAVFDDPAERARKVAAARKNVRANFSIDAIAARYKTRIDQILATL